MSKAEADARRAHRWEIFWWSFAVPLAPLYWFTSSQPVPDRAISLLIAELSVFALAISYGAKHEASLARG